MQKATYLVITLGLAAHGATAHADTDQWFPAGMTMDRVGTETWAANLELAYNAFDNDIPTVGTIVRFDLYGQYLAQVGANRLGGYASLPIVQTVGTEGDEEGALGSLEIGGAYAMATGPTTNVVFRGGVALPNVDENDAFSLVIASYGRLTDLYTSLPDFTWVRMSGSVLHEAAPYFLRADLGLDLPFSDGDEDGTLLRLNAAAGVDLNPVVLLGELATTGFLGTDEDERFVHTVALTVRMRGQTFSPGLGLVVPLDDDLQGFIDYVVVAGVRITGD